MSSRNVIITAALTSILTTICMFFGLHYLKNYRSKKPKGLVEVPLILGLPHAQADNVLRQAGLKLQVLERRPDAQFQKDTICVQVPPKGSKLPAGSMVTAVISDGQPNVTVPQVANMPDAQARALLSKAKLKLGRISSEPHDTVPKGNVIRCTPAPGTTVKPGTRVILFVSAGVDAIEVPKVKGRSYRAAKKKIVEAGFVVGKIRWRDNDDYDEYVVLSQDPAAGTKAPKGSKINISVNRGD